MQNKMLKLTFLLSLGILTWAVSVAAEEPRLLDDEPPCKSCDPYGDPHNSYCDSSTCCEKEQCSLKDNKYWHILEDLGLMCKTKNGMALATQVLKQAKTRAFEACDVDGDYWYPGDTAHMEPNDDDPPACEGLRMCHKVTLCDYYPVCASPSHTKHYFRFCCDCCDDHIEASVRDDDEHSVPVYSCAQCKGGGPYGTPYGVALAEDKEEEEEVKLAEDEEGGVKLAEDGERDGVKLAEDGGVKLDDNTIKKIIPKHLKYPYGSGAPSEVIGAQESVWFCVDDSENTCTVLTAGDTSRVHKFEAADADDDTTRFVSIRCTNQERRPEIYEYLRYVNIAYEYGCGYYYGRYGGGGSGGSGGYGSGGYGT